MPVTVLVVHFGIDSVKQRCSDTATAFAVDQAAHLLSLLVIAWLAVRGMGAGLYDGVGYQPLILLAGLYAWHRERVRAREARRGSA